mmetsp:Transcript_34807/g.62611  ORF Transcript_34807/g.62611 Transcript_34807/m.62611 type:complete len:358 (-) Transcript_34807:71-1144(-)
MRFLIWYKDTSEQSYYKQICLGALDELNTLLDGGNELGHEELEALLLVLSDLTEGDNLVNTLSAKSNLRGEESSISEGALDERALNGRLTVETTEAAVSEEGSRVGHGESGRALALLGVNDLSATLLGTLGEGLSLILAEGNIGSGLGEKGEDGNTSVTTDDGDVNGANIKTLRLSVEGLSADNIEGGNTHDLALVVDTELLKGLSSDRNSGVNRVGDDVKDGARAVLAASLNKVHDDTSVDLEKIITGHSGLTRNTGRDDDEVSTTKGLSEVVLGEALNLGVGVDVGNISSNTGGTKKIVEVKVRDLAVHLHEHGEGLTDATSSTEDSDLAANLTRGATKGAASLGSPVKKILVHF